MSGEDCIASLSESNGNRMKKMIKNIAASVKASLLKISKESNRDFIAILLQYFQERFLYRLSISPYRKNFILKGALLFLVYDMPNSRPTRDIDFLGIEIYNTEKNLLKIMNEVISIKVGDGVKFDSESLESEIIKEGTDYQGVRIYCLAYLDQAKIRIHFDIGFGDEIVPEPVSLDFPVLIPDMPCPELIAYSPESAIAEKFEAIVQLGFATSRMKDFYDIYYLSNHYPFDSTILKEAILATFKNRKTDINNRNLIFSDDYKRDISKQEQWIAFLKRLNIEIDFSFQDCIKYIENFIEPLFEFNNTKKIWQANKMIWEQDS